MSETREKNNTDTGVGTFCEDSRSGRGGEKNQSEASQVVNKRNPRPTEKKRMKWSRKDNLLLFECYCKSEPSRRGYRKRLSDLWKGYAGVRDELRDVNEQRLCDQVKNIKSKGWLTELERKKIEDVVLDGNDVVNEGEEIENTYEVDFIFDSEPTTLENVMDNEEIPVTVELDDNNVLNNLDDNILRMRERILEVLVRKPREEFITLKSCDVTKIDRNIKIVNQAIETIHTENITEDNELLYAAAFVISENLGKIKKEPKKRNTKEPFWKRRIQNSIKKWRKDLSQLEEVNRGRNLRERDNVRLEKSYKLKEKGARYVCEMLRQKIRAGGVKIKRYDERNRKYKENNLFKTNQKRFYEYLDKGNEPIEPINPEPEQATEFWKGIWANGVEHNENAVWLADIQERLKNINKQENIVINKEDVVAGIRKMTNWKSPGPDGVQGFWFKRLHVMHDRISKHLQSCLDDSDVPEWMTKGKTVLIVKDPQKGNRVDNFRPIACLPLMWKLLTGIFSERIYKHLESNELLVDEQKGCRKKSRGTKDQLLIDKAILKNCRRRHTNLSMSWVDYRKAYDLVPHSWILKCLKLMGVSENINVLVANSMKNWRTVLTSNNQELGEVEINRGIFQGDSLSPLLFVLIMIPLTLALRNTSLGYKMSKESEPISHLLFMDDLKLYASNKNSLDSLVNTVKIFSDDIRMEFGLSKCAVLELKRGKIVKTEGIDLGEFGTINEADPEGYKYLGILQLDTLLGNKMKRKIRDEYYRRVKKLNRSKLNGGNLINGLNAWAIGIVRYGAGVIEWTKEELKEMDRKTRKIISVNRGLHTRSNVSRLYIPRKEGGRGLIGVEECLRSEVISLNEYISNSTEAMLKEASREGVLRETLTLQEYRQELKREKDISWKDKPLHGKFYQEVSEIADIESWRWLRNGYLKKETEGMICAAQEQALRTNSIKFAIDKTVNSPLCRVCNESQESVQHIISGCTKLVQKDYKTRHDKVAARLHWEYSKRFNFDCSDKWYEHVPEKIVENEIVKIMWDMTMFTDKKLKHNRPDISIFDKQERKWTFIDVAVPYDANVSKTEDNKIDRYKDLSFEIERLQNCKSTVVPVVVGALGVVSKKHKTYLERLELGHVLGGIQMTAILGTANILRKVLRL